MSRLLHRSQWSHNASFYRSSDSDSSPLKEQLGPETPLYGKPKKGYSALEMLNILFGTTSNLKICTSKPCGVRSFASFVVDLAFVPLRDLQADDNGSWITSSPRRKYVVEKAGDDVVSVSIASEFDDDEATVTLYRQYGTHKGESSFKRIIATACDSSGRLVP